MNEAARQPLEGEPAARVLVAGASGFTGALAAQIVWRHPRLELVTITSRSDAGERLDRLYPRYRVPLELTELDLDRIEGVDAAIVAYPHGAAAPTVAALRGLGVLVVDLSADFRLRDLPTYELWYGEHDAPELLEDAVYGLTELYRDQLREAELVATPGCYPTASVLALAPLAERGLLTDVVIDAKQGVSGAGRGGGDEMHYVSMDENAFAYKTEGHRHRPEIEQELAALGSAVPVTFVPHLLPLDQGELTSCYATVSERLSRDEVQAFYTERYAGEPFVHVVDRPPGLRDVRDTNECHVYVTVEERGRVLAFSAIDNLWKGASGQGVQNLNLMLGLDETEGLDMSDGFFHSRWVDPPAGVEELDPAQLAPGFVAGAVACGLKESGNTDAAVVVAESEQVTSALLLTRNAAAAAPVRLCRENVDFGAIRAAAVKAGNANAATGEQGMRDSVAIQQAAAEELDLDPTQVAIAATGKIGEALPMDRVLDGIRRAADVVRPDGGAEFSEAIMTTDSGPKRCTVRCDGVTLSAQAKGAGMIQPGFATMLCFVQTDAALDGPYGAEAALREAVERSFERITVDGQMSTNDMVLLQASGESGLPLPQGLLDAVLLALALEIVADGEGTTRVGCVRVTEAASPEEAERAARAIANSPLVKTALFGHDPNWGRVAQAAGMALAGEEVEELGLDHIDASEFGGEETEAEVSLRLGRGDHDAHVWFSDLGYEYVRINAEYTT